MSRVLKPCPFCGEIPKIQKRKNSEAYPKQSMHIACCILQTKSIEFDDEKSGEYLTENKASKQLALLWNMRHF